MFKRKNKKTGVQTPEYTPPPMPPVKPPKTNPPNTGSNVQNPKRSCPYETPCGYCTKWDKKCDQKIGPCDPKVKYGDVLEDKSGTGCKTKQTPISPKCSHCGRSLKLLGGNPVETYFMCEFCGKPYILNVFTEKLVPEEDD